MGTAPHAKEARSENFKLREYYYAVVFSSLAVMLLFAFITNRFPEYFPWIRYPRLNFWLLIGTSVFQLVFFGLRETFKKKFFFDLDRYGFVVFFLLAIYATGGVESSFIFILLFPLLVSVVDLDERATKEIAIAVTVLLALLIFADPPYWHDPVFLVKHLFRVILYGLVAYYLYKIVKETLRQKYEKEEAVHKFVELSELERVKADFLTVAQHQLRTPLSGARWGLSNALSESALPKNIRNIVEASGKKVEDAIGIVNDMLRAAEGGVGGLTLAREPVDLAALIHSALDELSYLLAVKGTRVIFTEKRPVVVHGDSRLLAAACANILDNAIRYNPKGTVEVLLVEKSAEVELVVKDNGIGIPAEDLPYVFDRFYRGKNAMLLEPNESGVGLYVTKRIIERHGGSIAVNSSLGSGTTVSVVLPRESGSRA